MLLLFRLTLFFLFWVLGMKLGSSMQGTCFAVCPHHCLLCSWKQDLAILEVAMYIRLAAILLPLEWLALFDSNPT